MSTTYTTAFYTKEELLMMRLRGDFNNMRALSGRHGIHGIYWGMREKGWCLINDSHYGHDKIGHFYKRIHLSTYDGISTGTKLYAEGSTEWWEDLNDVLGIEEWSDAD